MLFHEVVGHEASERSFDFSKFPNLQGVDLGVGWVHGGLPWIHTALSTLRPTTSPHFSTIQLKFTSPYSAHRSVETVVKHTGDDLRQIADEITRIKREFRAVNVTVLQDQGFKSVLHTLNVGSISTNSISEMILLIDSCPFLVDPSTLISLERDPCVPFQLVLFVWSLNYSVVYALDQLIQMLTPGYWALYLHLLVHDSRAENSNPFSLRGWLIWMTT